MYNDVVEEAGDGVGAIGVANVGLEAFFFGRTGAELKPYLPDNVAKADA